MRRTESKEHVEFSVPGEEFYVTSDPSETFGRVITEELLIPASKRSVLGSASATFEEYSDTGTAQHYSFDDSSYQYDHCVIGVTSRNTEKCSKSFEELESIYDFMCESGVVSEEIRQGFINDNATFQTFVASEPRFFTDTRYIAIPSQKVFYAYTRYGYRTKNGKDIYIDTDEPDTRATTLSEKDEEIFEDSVNMMKYTVGMADIVDIVRALCAMNLVTQDEVKTFLEKLP